MRLSTLVRGLPFAVLALCVTTGRAAETDRVGMHFQDTPIREAVAQLAPQLDSLVLVDPAFDGKVTMDAEVAKSRALVALALRVDAVPRPTVIFCSEAEAKGTAKLERKPTVSLELAAGSTLADAVKALNGEGMLRVAALPSVAGAEVDYSGKGQPLDQVLDALAAKAKCKWVMGFMLAELDPQTVAQGIQLFTNLPPDQQRQLVDAAFNRGLGELRNMSPADRQEAVQMAVGFIDHLARSLDKADAATRAKFHEAIRPILQQGVQRFTTLNAREQADLMPVMKALKKLQ